VPQARDIPGSVDDWLARARSDLAISQVTLPETGFYEDLCYHAQQAAEKAIKAVYLHHGWGFEYVHNLSVLLSELESHGMGIPDEIKLAAVLSRYAFQTRYPGLTEPLTQADHEKAVKLAAAVVRWAEAITGKG
jgi:HEPN domain-containing protein